jgi:hypothetical protein
MGRNQTYAEFYEELYRLLVFFRLLGDLLDAFFDGDSMLVNFEVNRYYLRLCQEIRSILLNNSIGSVSYFGLERVKWRPYTTLRDVDMEHGQQEWRSGGKQFYNRNLGRVEKVFVSFGENTHALASEDKRLIEDVKTFLTQYAAEKTRRTAAVKDMASKRSPGKQREKGMTRKKRGRFSRGAEEKDATVAALTVKQAVDYKGFEYQCRDRVEIPGKSPLMRSNVLIVNGHEVKLEDSLFVLFLRLVLGLKKEAHGWIDLHSLEQERVISGGGKYQVFSRLRGKLEGGLLKKDAKTFIENDGSKRYRISTHPDFVTYDKEKLLQHPDEDIRKIAGQLP